MTNEEYSLCSTMLNNGVLTPNEVREMYPTMLKNGDLTLNEVHELEQIALEIEAKL